MIGASVPPSTVLPGRGARAGGGEPVRTEICPHRLPAGFPVRQSTGGPRRRRYASGSSQCLRPMLMIRIRSRAAAMIRSRGSGSSAGASSSADAVITMWST
jgi:hypothetical protein